MTELLAGLVAGLALGVALAFWWRSSLCAEIARLKERNSHYESQLTAERATTDKVQNAFKLTAVEALEKMRADADRDIATNKNEISSLVVDMKSRLEDYGKKVDRFEAERQNLYGKLEQQLSDVLNAEQSIRIETASLKRALTASSGVRGIWGQSVLQEILELNNLVAGVHFETQVSFSGEVANDSRPDFVINLPGGRKLIIDCKEVAGEYLLAQETDDLERQKEHYTRLVQNIRTNFIKLSRKEYQQYLDPNVPYVIMFIPNEAAIRAAFATDSGIFKEASERRVMLASPMTIIPLIHLIKHAWQQEQLANNARELGTVVEILGERLATFMGHLKKMRDGIQRMVDSWGEAVGSWEKRVSPQLDKVKSLGGKLRDAEDLTPIQSLPKTGEMLPEPDAKVAKQNLN